ncbi:putative ribonuclease H protein [Glycine soja]
MAGVSLKCGDCGALLRTVEEAQEHAELTSHSNFSESTEPVLNLICSVCSKPCRSKTESDLHTKRTGHTEFVDKTSEAVKPISLEAPKVDATASSENPSAAASTDKNEEMVVPEVDKKLLKELESMGFSTARATRALHYSGNAGLESAVNWIVEHENDPDIDQMPLVPANTKIEAPKPLLTPEEMKAKQQELRERARKKKEEEEKRMEREREKILVNGSPSAEFILQRGLEQGNPLAPLLFNIVAEGLKGLLREVLEKKLFKGFLVGRNNVEISILQYVDDAIFFGEASMENVKAIKVILRSFKLVSSYLNCKSLSIPFLYLGIPIGTNPRVPNKVLDKLVSLQCRFLWGGGMEQKKIMWVKWDTVCLPKEKGGLGIRDIKNFNLTLLGKWRWNLFHHQWELWAQVLDSKYGGWRNLDEDRRGNNESFWWQDLSSMFQPLQEGNWFQNGISWKVGCRARVRFWEDRWKDDGVPLMLKYPKLYLISCQQEQFIQQMGRFSNAGCEWSFQWRQSLFDAEIDVADKFLGDTEGISIHPGR